jgi:excisionase family DNA binding protein
VSAPVVIEIPAAAVDALADAVAARVVAQLGAGGCANTPHFDPKNDAKEGETSAFGRYLNVEQAAQYLGATDRRIYELTRTKRLPVHKDGTRSLYKREDLDACVERGS